MKISYDVLSLHLWLHAHLPLASFPSSRSTLALAFVAALDLVPSLCDVIFGYTVPLEGTNGWGPAFSSFQSSNISAFLSDSSVYH